MNTDDTDQKKHQTTDWQNHEVAGSNYWISLTNLVGCPVEIWMDGSFPLADREQIVADSLKRVVNHWKEIEENIVQSLHATYNYAWAVPEEGFPELGRDEFLKRIVPTSLHIHDGDDIGICLGLNFSDGGLFLGHNIHIFWTPEKMYEANLEG